MSPKNSTGMYWHVHARAPDEMLLPVPALFLLVLGFGRFASSAFVCILPHEVFVPPGPSHA